jgi:hypothetical protein
MNQSNPSTQERSTYHDAMEPAQLVAAEFSDRVMAALATVPTPTTTRTFLSAVRRLAWHDAVAALWAAWHLGTVRRWHVAPRVRARSLALVLAVASVLATGSLAAAGAVTVVAPQRIGPAPVGDPGGSNVDKQEPLTNGTEDGEINDAGSTLNPGGEPDDADDADDGSDDGEDADADEAHDADDGSDDGEDADEADDAGDGSDDGGEPDEADESDGGEPDEADDGDEADESDGGEPDEADDPDEAHDGDDGSDAGEPDDADDAGDSGVGDDPDEADDEGSGG